MSVPHGLVGESPIPLYYQLAAVLRSRILSGVYSPGERIGSESEIGAEFSVGRVTVRRALAALEGERLIERRRGAGTFVAAEVDAVATVELNGFLEDIVLHADYAGTTFIDRAELRASDEVAGRLEVQPGTPVVRFRRVRSTPSHPHAWVVNHLPAEIGRLVDPEELRTRSLLMLIDESDWGRLESGYETIAAAAADSEVAQRLGLQPGAPVLHVERTVRGRLGKVVEYVTVDYASEWHRFGVRLMRVRR